MKVNDNGWRTKMKVNDNGWRTKMKKIQAKHVLDDRVVFGSADELEDFYQCLENNENFIVQWIENNEQVAKLIVATNLFAKVKNGEIELESMGNKK